MGKSLKYGLYYWPTIAGCGEFVRLALEEVGAAYVDMAKDSAGETVAVEKLRQAMCDDTPVTPPFAPPFLKAGTLVIAQTANILLYLGAHHGLAPEDEAGRLWVHQLQLTLVDWVVEIHDTHHPLGPSLYYESQKAEAKRRAEDFLAVRLPKFMDYFERVLACHAAGDRGLSGTGFTYVDLSLFQIVAGLRYAFPRAMKRLEPAYPRIASLAADVSKRPRIAAYLSSLRRLPFNEDGLFRHYPELDD